jgi:hypothetical protein
MAAKRTRPDSAAEIAKTNPKVDLARLKAAEGVLADLRGRGLPRPTSTVTTPYGQPSIRLSREADEDGPLFD